VAENRSIEVYIEPDPPKEGALLTAERVRDPS
jgi:hypothetical protein